MNDTKSLIIFIVLSVVLLIWISILPESSPVLAPITLITPATAPYLAFETPDPAPVLGTPFGWTVTVVEYK